MVKQLFRTTSICVESLELLIDKLDGELKSFVAIIENAIQKQEPEYGIQSCDMYPGKSVFFGIVFQICINKAFVYLDFIVNSILHSKISSDHVCLIQYGAKYPDNSLTPQIHAF
ncbi:uncharacterized protein OCT59_018662 [Rhizophagus irregularis]|uniref:uncharacterized protein n=1 Tax=Rhizophagus irregularis TaxID=588596 RepID=UPI0033182737|nr:hypothetical protein OCT59_018662 [Rhizophagus irregularis]